MTNKPIDIKAIMKGPRLKVERANSHIDAIVRDASPLSKDLYEVTNGPGRSLATLAKPDCFELACRPKKPITDHFSVIIGDAVNNLRESLDYWANAVVRVFDQPRKVYFPFSDKWEDLETSPNFRAIEKSFPDAAEFIRKQVKPCRDTNLHLWAATSLCNFNKHNDFVPIVTFAGVKNFNARFGRSTIKNCNMSGYADRAFSIILAREPITLDNNFSTFVEITFPKGAIFEDQPVVPTLLEMSRIVSQTLDALEGFLRPYAK